MTITMEKERENHIPAHVEGHRGRTQLNLQYLLLPKAVNHQRSESIITVYICSTYYFFIALLPYI